MLCLQNQWIHIDGDSLARDVFYDMNEIFGLGWNDKHKTLENLSQGGGATGNSSERPLITFSSDTIKFRDTPNWYPLLQGVKRGCPDVWIYSSGLWDHPKNTSDAKYYKRTKALANFSASFSDCEIKHKILRYTTPYQLPSRLMLNERAKRYNEIATELLVPVGFQYVDTFEMLSSRPDLSHDGVHYTGPGSKWVTNSILNLICPSSSS
ncbi:expressed unknown protein [Seminavis robusta]|uniref:Uncharacterized protein n=1 Tax=Seminavis robusta TaxID=568900 RepID=A0A9N8DBC0_9STRA|nr:expressed unknown protein [Seminavis robusta]|eukprot:Sro74_g040850.1 n/a (209) ;mRNA; f:91178-91804